METSQLAHQFLDALLAGSLSWTNALAVGVLILVVAALKVGLAKLHPFFTTASGTILINVVTSGLTAAALAFMAGAAFKWVLLGGALAASIKAAGGVSLLKHLLPLVPGLTDLLLKLPFVSKLFPPKGDAPALVTEAQKAGLAAAVAAKAPSPESVANAR